MLERDPAARRRDAEKVPGFGPAIWKASVIASPPPFSQDEGYIDWFHDTAKPPPAADVDAPDGGGGEDPWADF